MASSLSRRFGFRLIHNAINSQCRSLTNPFHHVPRNCLHISPTRFFSHQFFVHQCKFLPTNTRFFCAPAPGSRVNPSTNSNATNACPAQLSNSNATSTLPTGSEASSGTGNDGNQSSGGSHHSSQQGKPVRGGPVSWTSFFLLLCTGMGLIYYYDREKKRHIEGINSASTAVRQGPSVGKAAIGGPFNLLDHNGTSVSEKTFLGHWNLIYFGFTHCPDICPDELQKLASAIDKIKEKSGIEVVPIFISVDPERDTVEQVHEYVKEFHPKLVGLTGTPDEIKKTARAYRVYYMKTEEEGSDYLVDHSIVMYLMDPNMEFLKFFGKNVDAVSLADGIIREIEQHKK